MKKTFRFSLLLLILISLFNLHIGAASTDVTMVVTNPGPNASTEMNISWHTTNAFAAIQYTKATDPNFQSPSTKLGVCTALPFSGKENTKQCKATLTNLESGTEYLYRIQTTAFSDVYRFKTAGTGPFSFMHITDIHSYLPIPSRVSTANTVLNKA
ncbi:MAG TPA: fibronectin type III domain-containing protein, partial [Bacilli bacterium]|nr:fibronectin type III domain-containing protein [Bacilli bacterium]